MTIEEIVAKEVAKIRPEFTKQDWFTLGDVVREALIRVAIAARAEAWANK